MNKENGMTGHFRDLYFQDLFGRNLGEAEILIEAYPEHLREDVLFAFLKVVHEGEFYENTVLSMMRRTITTEFLLDVETEYEGTIRKLLLLSFMDGKLRKYTHVQHKTISY